MPALTDKTRREAENAIFERGHTVRWYDDGCVCQDCGAIGYYQPGENTQTNNNPFHGDIFLEECAAIMDEMGLEYA